MEASKLTVQHVLTIGFVQVKLFKMWWQSPYYLSKHMQFRCIQIRDREERNRFEKLLIATLARCTVCQPSNHWLGRFSYSEDVRSTGLWNSDFVHGPPLTEDGLRRFRELTTQTPGFKNNRDLSDTLLIIPCSGEKKGDLDPHLPERKVADYVESRSVTLLEEGRRLAFGKTLLEGQTELRPALAWYTGQPYATEGFRELLIDALRDGLHCLIVSGGYGLLRPEESIHRYKAHLPTETLSIWRQRIPAILNDYVVRNRIRRTFSSFSSGYAAVVSPRLAEENWRAVPQFNRKHNSGAALRVVPKEVGLALISLLHSDFHPGKGWEAV